MRFLFAAALSLLPGVALAQSSAGGGGGGGGGGGSSGPYYVGQYNATLPAFANGQVGYAQLDSNGRMLLAPGSTVTVTGTVTANIGTANGVVINNQASQTTSGAVQPPTAAVGKISKTSTALSANASTAIAAANANRIALAIQCGSGAVSVDETGAALTAAGVGNGTLFIPSSTAPYFVPPVASLTALTAYTATAQTCVVTEYLR